MKRFIIISSVLALMAGFSACNKQNTGEAEVEELKALVVDESGKVIFDESAISGLYQIGVENKEEATDLVYLYAGKDFTESNYTRTLPGDKGTVKVTKGTDGVFWTLRFAVVGIPSFTLDVIDANGENNDAKGKSGTYHKCSICNRSWKSENVTVCPWTPIHEYL